MPLNGFDENANTIEDRYSEEIEERFILLCHLWFNFEDTIRQNYDEEIGNHATLNEELLYVAVVNYFSRIDILKAVHRSIMLAPPKRAALTAMWLSHIRPIMLGHIPDWKLKPVHMLINERFAQYVAMNLLDLKVSDLTNDLQRRLDYILRLGCRGEEEMVLWFESFSENCLMKRAQRS